MNSGGVDWFVVMVCFNFLCNCVEYNNLIFSSQKCLITIVFNMMCIFLTFPDHHCGCEMIQVIFLSLLIFYFLFFIFQFNLCFENPFVNSPSTSLHDPLFVYISSSSLPTTRPVESYRNWTWDLLANLPKHLFFLFKLTAQLLLLLFIPLYLSYLAPINFRRLHVVNC